MTLDRNLRSLSRLQTPQEHQYSQQTFTFSGGVSSCRGGGSCSLNPADFLPASEALLRLASRRFDVRRPNATEESMREGEGERVTIGGQADASRAVG